MKTKKSSGTKKNKIGTNLIGQPLLFAKQILRGISHTKPRMMVFYALYSQAYAFNTALSLLSTSHTILISIPIISYAALAVNMNQRIFLRPRTGKKSVPFL